MAVAVVVDLKPGKRAAGQGGEERTSAPQDRALVLVAIPFDAAVHHRRGQFEGRISRDVFLKPCQERLR